MYYFKVCHPRCVCNSLGGRRIVKTTQLIRKKGVYSNVYKLHVSANSGHHQVYYRFKRKS